MDIAALQADEALRRHEFPVAAHKVFLGHAGVCPLPRRVAEAMSAYLQVCTEGDQETTTILSVLQETRELAARLLHCTADEVAIVGPTSLALSYIAGGLKLRRNHNVLIYQDDYPSNVYPWMAMGDRGVEVRLLNVRQLGEIRPRDVLGQVDENTRLVALSSCHYLTGYRIELDTIGKALRERGILFCVDAIQTVGAFPTTVDHVDFLAADSHKWMLGPCGAGIMYVRQAVMEQLNPIVYGWNNVRCPNFVAQEELYLRDGARRYEVGTHVWAGVVGLNACLKLIEEVGIANIAAELLRKRTKLIPALQAKGFTVLGAGLPDVNSGGMLSFHKPGADLIALHKTLLDAGFYTSLRTTRSGHKLIRLSPHFYTTDDELQRLIEAL